MKIRMIALATALVAGLSVGQALAQYPPPAGNIVTQPTNPNPGVNTDAPLLVTVQSEAGVAAANVACSAVLASQPGTDASVSPANFSTNAAGQATVTVYTGSSAGQIQVAVSCGQLSATATMVVGASAPLPPDTGAGLATADGNSGTRLAWVFGATSIAAAAAGAAVLRRKQATHR